jgi:hypothetical protein
MTGNTPANALADLLEGGAPDPDFDDYAEGYEARIEADVRRAARLLQQVHDLLGALGPTEGWHVLTGWVEQLKPEEVKRGAPRKSELRDAWEAKQAAPEGQRAAVVQEWAARLGTKPASLDRELRRLNPEMQARQARQDAIKNWFALIDEQPDRQPTNGEGS